MQKAIALSVCAETIEESYAIWRELVEELKEIVEEKEINNQWKKKRYTDTKISISITEVNKLADNRIPDCPPTL